MLAQKLLVECCWNWLQSTLILFALKPPSWVCNNWAWLLVNCWYPRASLEHTWFKTTNLNSIKKLFSVLSKSHFVPALLSREAIKAINMKRYRKKTKQRGIFWWFSCLIWRSLSNNNHRRDQLSKLYDSSMQVHFFKRSMCTFIW